MCGCKTCVIFDDMHKCLNLFWKKYITKLKKEVHGMRNRRRKFDLSSKLETYIEQVCTNSTNLHPKYKSGWDAASTLGCPPVTINKMRYCRFWCALRECTECSNNWKDLNQQWKESVPKEYCTLFLVYIQNAAITVIVQCKSRVRNTCVNNAGECPKIREEI